MPFAVAKGALAEAKRSLACAMVTLNRLGLIATSRNTTAVSTAKQAGSHSMVRAVTQWCARVNEARAGTRFNPDDLPVSIEATGASKARRRAPNSPLRPKWRC